MTGAARATVLLLAVGAFAVAFVIGAAVTYHLAVREPAPRHLRPARRHHVEPSREWLKWTVGAVVRFVRYEDGGPKAAVVFAGLFLAFSVLIGASQ